LGFFRPSTSDLPCLKTTVRHISVLQCFL